MMKLTVLVDNNTYIDQYYLAEPALSYLLQDGDDTVLFDVGYSDVFMINAKRMNIDLHQVNKLVLSHGHNDHTGGLIYFKNQTQPVEVIAHPDVDVYKNYQAQDVGSPLQLKDLPNNFILKLSNSPLKITNNITFLGEIPRVFTFEGQPLENDQINDDSALIYHNLDTLWVITGCSHSGICNICEYAKKISGIDHITGIIGGFHLLDNPYQLKKTVAYLKANPVDIIYPAHCSDLKAKIELAKVATIKEVGVGLSFVIK